MLMVLSPAKSLDYETPVPAGLEHTRPVFVPQAAELVEVMRAYTPAQLSSLMDISDALAVLNVGRFAAWSSRFTAHNARQAVLAFDGDVYGGLQARTLSADDLGWAQSHLAILSGLYGVLRPLDWMQAYRLEMGSRVATAQGKDLYQFWGERIARELQHRLDAQRRGAAAGAGEDAVVVNLASQEYFKAVKPAALKARVVECVFEEGRGGGVYKVISFMAKRARGLMARSIIEHRWVRVEQLQGFAAEGYAWAPEQSSAGRLVFRRAAA
jgi:uncharacterized protein